MRLRPTKHYRSPAYPAIAMAALTAVGAAANAANRVTKGRPAPPKLPPVESKPPALLGDVAVPVQPARLVSGKGILIANVTFVPITALKDSLGVNVIRDPGQPDWTLKLGAAQITLAPGRLSASANGRQIRLPAMPMMVDGILHVPVRSVGQALGISVSRRGADIALSTPTGRKMLILRTAPPKPVPTPGVPPMPPMPESIGGSRKGS
jgi:hypothetical protein